MTPPRSVFRFLLAAAVALFTALLITLGAAYLYLTPQLPDIERLQDVQFSVPLRVYTNDGLLIAEFGEQRRTPVRYQDLPQTVIDAILATEDDRFFEHPGVDYQGLIRAAIELVRTGKKRQGGSTITMQVARNFFLSREKTYLRKLTEIFLALKIERALSKQEILELYLNKIYFGHRAYGVAAAARVYYGLPIDRLSVAQVAMIAGLPKAPSANNPISNPTRALERRNYVLGRMYTLGFIDAATYRDALNEADNASLHAPTVDVQAPWLAEMVRAFMLERYGEDAYSAGYRVITTLDSRRQRAANRALRSALLAYDRRHGYRGAEQHVELSAQLDETEWAAHLQGRRRAGGLLPGLVTAVEGQSARVYLADEGVVTLGWDGLAWARPYLSVNRQGPAPETAASILRPGDLVRLEPTSKGGWRLAQLPEVEGALVSLRPRDGAVQALAGGFSFSRSKFNRATQAQRQPGSSFKPFIYSAALAKGYTAASIFNDAPVVFDDPSLETTWRPENYSGKFYGPTRLREALTRSRNLVSIRLLRAIGPGYAARYVQRFGFDADQIPRDLSLALGSGAATPWQMARAYSVFANGGYLIEPYFIAAIYDASGEAIYKADPPLACPECEAQAAGLSQSEAPAPAKPVSEPMPEAEPAPRLATRVLPQTNVYLMTSMMQDVVRRGTGRRAMALGRHDLAGKTGTTNDQRDAWFCGFNPALVTTVWVGFDQVQPLGNGETGSRAALPMWISYMGEALKGVPETTLPQPPGLVTVRIDPATGLLMPPGVSGGLFEVFRAGHVPRKYSGQQVATPGQERVEDETEPLF